MKWVDSGTGYSHTVGYSYDDLNNLTAMVETINGVEHTTSYTYDTDNRVTSKVTDNIGVYYTYDSLGRLTQQVTKNGNTTIETENYTYHTGSAQVATHSSTSNGKTSTISYTYDDNGNLLSMERQSGYRTEYVYDSANQLIAEYNSDTELAWFWTYDNAGNITNRKSRDYSQSTLGPEGASYDYTYSDEQWGDLLTGYNGATFSYDQIGNLTDDGTWEYTWQHGRQLARMTNGNTTWNYTYNADGMRTKRTNGTTTYEYIYNGSQLVQLNVDGNTLCFTYDAQGGPVTVTYNGTVYYYSTNLQGDVTAITNADGSTLISCLYTAYGQRILFTDATLSGLALYNPLWYRGYVYDTETGLYYLQSRYYNPTIGRFINADGLVSTGQGFVGNNMFAYCLNNPVNLADATGKIGIFTVLGGIAALFAIILIPSSQKQEATQQQKDNAVEAAQDAQLNIRNDASKNPSTIDINIVTEEVLEDVDSVAYEYYYEALYDRTLDKAAEVGMPTDNLMDTWHIQWEFELHVVAYYLGFDNALLTELNIEETPWSMFKRAIGWD